MNEEETKINSSENPESIDQMREREAREKAVAQIEAGRATIAADIADRCRFAKRCVDGLGGQFRPEEREIALGRIIDHFLQERMILIQRQQQAELARMQQIAQANRPIVVPVGPSRT